MPKMTLDIWYLKMIPAEFRVNMPTDFTSAVMQLTCHQHQETTCCTWQVHSLAAVQAGSEFFDVGLFPVAHRATHINTIHTQTAIPNILEKVVILDQCHPTEHSAVMSSLHFQYGSYQSYVTTKHLKCGQWDGGVEFLILMNLHLNKPHEASSYPIRQCSSGSPRQTHSFYFSCESSPLDLTSPK